MVQKFSMCTMRVECVSKYYSQYGGDVGVVGRSDINMQVCNGVQ